MDKIIIAGGREFIDYGLLVKTMDSLLPQLDKDITVLCGGARGADAMGKIWADANNHNVTMFPAQWDLYGKAAGYRRNANMAKEADGLVAFWDGKSKGTQHMINLALGMSMPIHIVKY